MDHFIVALPVLVSWSSGKDSAWALHTLRSQPEKYEVRGIFTTVTTAFDRVSIQATPRSVLKRQAEALRLPLYEIPIRYSCSNAEYESAVLAFLGRIRALPAELGVSHLAFGDLFLGDIREYRESRLEVTGFTPIFPVWGMSTAELAETMISSGLRAIVTALNPTMLPASFAGRWFDREFLDDLPDDVDPLGENGEFHTCVVAGPMFPEPINAVPVRIVTREISPSLDEDDEDDPIHRGSRTLTCIYADVKLLD